MRGGLYMGYIDDLYEIGEKLNISAGDAEIYLHTIINILELDKYGFNSQWEDKKKIIEDMDKQDKECLVRIYKNI